MAEFFRETQVKATRKSHLCSSCERSIDVGSPAVYMAMKQDGEFWAAHAHVECREAECAWNSLADQWDEDFSPLWMVREADDREEWFAWLREHHPIAAARVIP
jgi:hypothetical protein